MDHVRGRHALAILALKAHPGATRERARGIELTAVTVDLDGLAELERLVRGGQT
jgi:hypothetical protein